jgi:ParB-like nuclease family protein
MGTMPRLKIAALLARVPTDPEAHLNPERVERYARMLDTLPPVVVFDTPQGPLLADGYHRLAAARRSGLETVEAEVRVGSRQEALRYAAEVGGAQRGISAEEAASHIRRHAKNSQVSAP